MRKEHGEPDVIEVRQTFNDSLQAREWEAKILWRLKVLKTDRWINKNIKGAIQPMYGDDNPARRQSSREKISLFHKGKAKSELAKENMRKPKSTTVNMTWSEERKQAFRRPKSESAKANMRKAWSDETRKNHSKTISNLKWITNGLESKRVDRHCELPEGWRGGRHLVGTEGRTLSEERKIKIKQIRKNQVMQSGWFWINDGIQNQRCFNDIPEGFKRGLIHGKSTTNTRKQITG